MAYLNFLAAVRDDDVVILQRDLNHKLSPSMIVGVSHLLGSPGWVPSALAEVFGQVLDGGEVLCISLWHPLRSPRYHSPAVAEELRRRVEAALSGEPAVQELPDDDWYRIEFGKIIAVLEHAAANGEGIASVLQPPFDQERASRVIIPWQAGS